MRLLSYIAVISAATIAIICVQGEEQPKYGGNFEPSNLDFLAQFEDDGTSSGGNSANVNNGATAAAQVYNQTIDSVIDTILSSGRQGRNLDGFDEIYSDPNVQEVIQKGDDRQARNVIKDKLCSLGLMDCDGAQTGEHIEGKRPFLPPGELIYSQPPPGYYQQQQQQHHQQHNGPYGAPRPMPPPPQKFNGPPQKYNGPPRKVGYAGSPYPQNQNYNRPPGSSLYVESKPPGAFYEGPSPPGPIYQGGSSPSRPPYSSGQIFEGPKPPGPIYEGDSPPYKFDSVSSSSASFNQLDKYETNPAHDYHPSSGGLNGKPTIVVNAQGGAATTSASGAAANTVNIHHHYHHLDGEASKGPAVVVNPISTTQGASYVGGNSLSSSSAEYSSSSLLNSGGGGGFSPSSSYVGGGASSGNGGGIYGGAYKPISEPGNNLVGTSGPGGLYENSGAINSYGGYINGGNGGASQFGTSGSGSYGAASNQQSTFGQTVSASYNVGGNNNPTQESFHSQNPGYYKKALNTNSGGGLNSLSQYSKYGQQQNGGGNSFNQLNGGQQQQQFNTGENQYQSGSLYQQTSRQEFDCICVPYDQCPSQDVIGRKDDLILPLDPRNIKTDIEALEEGVGGADATVNGTRVAKSAVSDDEKLDKKEITDETKDEEDKVKDEVKVVRKKREATAEPSDVASKKADDSIDQADGEARLLGLGGSSYTSGGYGYGGGGVGVGGYGNPLGNKKVVPTFGVSFGLPIPTNAYNGYPLNPYGGTPAQNPYFGSLSPNGLNLGLVNVNPLVSFQVAKNEHGEKLFKPLVNLHVTPNANIIQKVGDLLKSKKFGFGGGQGSINQHYHTHTHYPNPPEIYHPHHVSPPHSHGNYHHQHHEHQHYVEGGSIYPSGPNGGYFPSGPGGPGGPGGPYPSGPGGPPSYPSGSFSSGPPGSFGGSGGGGYGFSGPQGYYRDGTGSNNYDGQIEQYDYNNNNNNNNEYFNGRSFNNATDQPQQQQQFVQMFNYQDIYPQNQHLQSATQPQSYADYSSYNQNVDGNNNNNQQQGSVSFPTSRRRRRDIEEHFDAVNADEIPEGKSSEKVEKRQAYYQQQLQRPQQQCNSRQVCCRRPIQQQRPQVSNPGQCGRRNTNGITGRIKNPVYVDGDSEFGEYPWQVAILKKDPKESVYICGGTLIDHQHILTAAHCIKTYTNFDLRVRLGEWDVNHDVEFFPYVERDVVSVVVHPEYYAGTLDNDLAILRLNQPVDFANSPHISPACLPEKFADFTGARCWTTGWGKDAFGDYGKYQNILKEVDVPIIGQQQCQQQLRQTRLGYSYNLNPGFICAGGEEGKDACKGDGGGPMVCERGGVWQLVGVVSWGIGCGQVNVPGVYVRVSHYLDWIQQNTRRF